VVGFSREVSHQGHCCLEVLSHAHWHPAQSWSIRLRSHAPVWAERIARNLLCFGRHAAILDATCGEGDLLAPFAAVPGVDLYGVEISRARAEVAQQRLPQATLVVSAIEAVRITPASMGALVLNPPYFFEDGRRAEYRIIADAGVALRPGGILAAILPARSAWDGTMINHWCKHYEQIRCWKFPDGDPDTDEGAFQKYTQIVVIGVRRAIPLKAPEALEQQRLSGWRWRQPRKAESPWAQGTPPPDLPEQPIADPYLVPEDGTVVPELIPQSADEATLLAALAQSGVQRSADWVSATTWQPEQQAERPIMPPTGEAHLAAEILTGLLDGEALTGPDGDLYAFVTCISQESHQVQLDPEDLEREYQKGVVSVEVSQLDDHPVLGCLNLRTGEAAYHQGEDVFTFLTPWLHTLASRVLAKRQPLYRLNPAQWELEVAARIGLDKHLPSAAHPGLVAPQVHRVCAMGTALDARGRVAIQGEPGTGKTRQSTAVMARQAAIWQRARRGEASEEPTPAWVRKLRLAWQATPRARALLGPTRQVPPALPVLVSTPKRVTSTWREEMTAAWPEAEVRSIDNYRDIDAWMRRCVESRAPAVIAIVPHSQSRAFGREWQPAVIERRIPRSVPDLDPAEERKLDLEPIIDQGRLAGYRVRATGEVLTKQVFTSSFHCPDCGALVQARPWGKREEAKTEAEEPAAEVDEETRPSEAEDEALEPVTERVWFEQKPRWCRACHGALWTEARTKAAASRAHPVPFATWAAGAEARVPSAPQTSGIHPVVPFPRRPDGRLGKAHRQPTPALQAATSRVLDAAGARGPAAPESFSPYEYAQQFYHGCIGLAVVDESHNARGRATDIAHAIHQAQLAAQTTVYASGTHYGGTIDDLFFYWYRFSPRFWRRLGLGWNDVEQAMARFGVIQQWTKEKEEDARRGSGRSDVTVTTVPAPGISARLLPFLLGDLVFLSVLDVGAHMPPRIEVPEIVSMSDPDLAERVQPAQVEAREAEETLKAAQRQVNLLRAQLPPPPAEDLAAALEDQQQATERRDEAKAALLEAQRWAGLRDLLGQHQNIMGQLRDLAQRGSSAAALAQGTIPRWWSVLPCVTPAFTVEQRKRGKWGELVGKEMLLTAPILTANHVYPLERRLQELVAQKLDAGQTVMIYFEQNGLRSMAERLAWVLLDFQPWILPNGVEAEDREHAIRAAIRDQGKRVVLVPYRRVMEGLNLQDCIDVVAWYELALNLFHLDQASRRHWRLGRREAAEIIYLAYAGSAAHRKLYKLARESGAAAAFAGEPARGALVEHVGAHQTMLARLSASLEALGDEEDEAEALDGQEELAAAFARRAEDLTATLKRGRQWLGLVDTLPERLATLHAARLAAAPVIVETAPAAEPPAVPLPLTLPHLAPPTPIKREEVVRGSLWDALEEEAEETEPAAGEATVSGAEEEAEAAAPPPVASPPAEAPVPLVQGSITTTRSGLVVTFPAKGPHLAAMQQLSRAYGGRFDGTSGAWVLPLLTTREEVHVVDAVLEAFPMLSGAEDARVTALETMLSVLANRYRTVYHREPNEQAMRAQVATCTEALRWLRQLFQRRS